MNRDEFGGIAVEDRDEFGGVAVASNQFGTDEFGGVALDAPPDELGIGQEVRGVGRAVQRGALAADQGLTTLGVNINVANAGAAADEWNAAQRALEDFDRQAAANPAFAQAGQRWRQQQVSKLAELSAEVDRRLPQIKAAFPRIARRETQIQALPPSPDLANLRTDFWATLASNPVETIATVVAESLPQMAPGLVGAAAGGGPLAVGANSFGVEYANALLDTARTAGADLTDPAQVEAFFRDPQKLNAARQRGVLRGLPVAAFDAASAGLAGRFLQPALGTGARNVAVASAKELGMQAGLGMGGETAGQLAADRRITSVPDIVLEGIAELGSGPAEVLGNVRGEMGRPTGAPPHPPSAIRNPQSVDPAVDELPDYREAQGAGSREQGAPSFQTVLPTDVGLPNDATLEGGVTRAQERFQERRQTLLDPTRTDAGLSEMQTGEGFSPVDLAVATGRRTVRPLDPLTNLEAGLAENVPAEGETAMDRMLRDRRQNKFREKAEVLRARRDAWINQTLAQAGELGSLEYVSTQRPDRSLIVSPVPGQPGRWRTTIFDDRGPMGHYEFDSREQAVRAVGGEHHTDKIRGPGYFGTGEYVLKRSKQSYKAEDAGRPLDPLTNLEAGLAENVPAEGIDVVSMGRRVEPKAAEAPNGGAVPELPTVLAEAIAAENRPDVFVEHAVDMFGESERGSAESIKPSAEQQRVLAQARQIAAQRGWDWNAVQDMARQQLGLDANFLKPESRAAKVWEALQERRAELERRRKRTDESLGLRPEPTGQIPISGKPEAVATPPLSDQAALTVDPVKLQPKETRNLAAEVKLPEAVKQALPPLAPKEQKKFLLSEIDRALAEAPAESPTEAAAGLKVFKSISGPPAERAAKLAGLFEQYGIPTEQDGKSAIPAKNLEGTQLGADMVVAKVLDLSERENLLQRELLRRDLADNNVVIEVPGDGIFTIRNTVAALKDFKERAAKFPTTAARMKEPSMARAGADKVPAKGKADAESIVKVAATHASTDTTREIINYIWSDGKQTVSTDGRRLLVVDKGIGGTKEKPLLVGPDGKPPRKALDREFPNWRQVIPDAPLATIPDVNIERLWTVVRQASEATDESNESFRLLLNPDRSLGVQARLPDKAAYDHNVQADAEPLAAFNAEYMLDALSALRRLGSDTVALDYIDDRAPIVMRGDNAKVVLMPMRGAESDRGGAGAAKRISAIMGGQPFAKPAPKAKRASKAVVPDVEKVREALKSAYPFSGIKTSAEAKSFVSKAKRLLKPLGIAPDMVDRAVERGRPQNGKINFPSDQSIYRELFNLGYLIDPSASAQPAPSSADTAIAALESLKVDTAGKVFDAIQGIPVLVWNGALNAAQLAIRAGQRVAQAIDAALAHIRANHRAAFDEPAVRAELERDLLGPVRVETGSPLPDFQPYAVAQRIFTQPFGAETLPWIGRLFGPRGKRVLTAVDRAVVTHAAENGVGKAVAAGIGTELAGRVDAVFRPNDQGDLNVTPRTPGQSLKVADVLEALQRDPDSYTLTPAQRVAWERVLQPLLKLRSQLVARYGLAQVEDAAGDLLAYFPRIVIETPHTPDSEQRPGGATVGGRQGFQKSRAFRTEREGWEAGYRYEPSIEKRLVSAIERLYKAMADQRLANNPALAGRTRNDVVAELMEWHAEELGAGLMTEADIQRKADGIMSRGAVNLPAFAGRTFAVPNASGPGMDLSLTQQLERAFPRSESRLRDLLVKGNNAVKAVRLGFDLGAPLVQGLPLFFRNPATWGKATGASFRALFSPVGLARMLQTPENRQAVRELAQLGSPIGSLPEMLAGLGNGELLDRIPVFRGVKAAFGRQFSTFMDVAKLELWKAHRGLYPQSQWPELAQSLEALLLSGRMDSVGVSRTQALTERVVLLAPSYYRGAVNLVAMAARPGVSGQVARRALLHFGTGMLASFVSVGLALGMKEEELKRRLDPTHPQFLQWTVRPNEQRSMNFGFGGIFRSWVKLLGNMVRTSLDTPGDWLAVDPQRNPLSRWLRGHLAPIPAAAMDLTGRDFMGRQNDLTDVPAQIIPLWAAQMVDKTGQLPPTWRELTASWTGLSGYSQTPFQYIRSRAARWDADRLRAQGQPPPGKRMPEESPYARLEWALRLENYPVARKEYEALITHLPPAPGKTPQRMVLEHFRNAAQDGGFVQYRAHENDFRKSLSREEQELYELARKEQRDLFVRLRKAIAP